MGKLLRRPAFEKMISKVATKVKAPVVTEAPVAPAPPVDYRRVNLKNVYDNNSVLKRMFSNPEDYLSLFAKGGPVEYSYDNKEIMYAPKDQEIMNTTLSQDSKTEVASAPENSYWVIVQDAYDKAGGREGTGLGFFDFANMYFPNPMADGGIVGLAGGGSAGFPPISYPFIDTPEQNLTVGISERQNPFVSYSKQFDIFGGQGGMGIYKEENVPPSVGVQIGRTNDDSQFSAGFNYSPDMGPRAQIEFQKQFPVGGGLNSLFRRK